MAWPSLSTGTNVMQSSLTTIRWGTTQAWAPNTSAIVLSADCDREVEKIYLEQGEGLKSTRIMLNQGQTWNFTLRDDATIFASGTSCNIGDQVVVTNFLTGGGNYSYKGTIVDTNYRAAQKQEGQRTIRVENITLIDATSA